MLKHPEVAFRDCFRCRKYMYNEKGEEEVSKRLGGKPVPRPKGVSPLCETSKGCPKGHWSAPLRLSQRNLAAYHHYRECKAVGRFPDDPIVRRNAAIIAAVEDSREKELQLQLMTMKAGV